MMDLSGKRLLIMGGVPNARDIVKKAHELGVHVMVTDYLEDSPAKKIADESFMVSTTDIDAVVKLCQEQRVDGVFTGYIDSMLPYCCEVCERLGLPFYATKKQLECTTNKRSFKDACLLCGVPVARDYQLDSPDIPYPVAVKPVDNSGSRGFAVCHSREELEAAYQRALTFSTSKKVIIEEFLEGKEVTLYYTVQNGKVTLSTISERFHQPGFAQLPAATLFFAEYFSLYDNEMHESVCRFAKMLGMKNGSFILQTYYTEDGFKCMEIIHRLSGIREYVIVSHENEIDIVKMHIRHALTGEFTGWDASIYDNPKFTHVYAYITFLLNKPGKIGEISGIQEIRMHPNVIDISPVYAEGDVIPDVVMGTLQQIFARCYIVADDKKELAEAIRDVEGLISVYDSDGNNMLLPPFDTREFYNA
jgi:biotin carboxylase